ncbi:toxin-activating lysine-acyltransferase [Pseudoduganella buxea]|nr:toxin-activating lysine-acyltransferase [Pseudoduganella buxea]
MAMNNALPIGQALTLLGRTQKYAEAPLPLALAAIKPAIGLKQFHMLHAPDGSASALLTWGWISAFTMNSEPVRPVCALSHGEWNEGEHLCIFDVLAPPHLVAPLLTHFFDHIAADHMTIHLYPSLRDAQSLRFTAWESAHRGALIASLGGA